MAIDKRTITGVIVGLLFLALYTQYAIQHLALPIPTAVSVLVTLLPVIQGFSTWYLASPPTTGRRRRRLLLALPTTTTTSPPPSDTRNAAADPRTRLAPPLLSALTILTTVLATLAGTHLPPALDDDSCALRARWLALFRAKNGPRIQAIQDALECCGFRSVYDMAWPFPQPDRGGRMQRSTCAETFGRSEACLAGWRGQERVVAGLLVVVCLGSWACQMIVTTRDSSRPSWFQQFKARGLRDDASESDAEVGHGNERSTRAIDFRGEGRYTDNPSEDPGEAEPGQPAEGRGGMAIENARSTDT
ncbi:tetraspanin tsp3 [Diplodia corticola]|uniref:Tetraspanin tsp3 n=1 Tax=Diplodia corticola TaxID=236234 RepID=A0A1J9RES1_9PEZI|nr:tetraspanin tsp3 [Diplodia corticola]OJD39048.1 tetraspanin tsp3 [Diplodia corticola]